MSMKDLLVKTAEETAIVDKDQLADFFENDNSGARVDDALLRCPYFTEEQVLRLFSAALNWEFFEDIPDTSMYELVFYVCFEKPNAFSEERFAKPWVAFSLAHAPRRS